MTPTLALSIELLKEQLSVDEIFQWSYNRNGKKYDMLHIHLQPKPGLRFGDAREICEAILSEVKQLHFTLYFTKEVQKEIDLGMGRFYLICQPNNRIYLNTEHKSSIAIPQSSTATIVKLTKEYIEKEKAKILSFMDGYYFYFQNENYPHAAFMLHQAIELACRTAQKLLSGDEKKSHSLKNNIDFLKIFDSQLGKLYGNSTEEEALCKLNESYISFRYEQNFAMDVQKITLCKDIAERAISWIVDYETQICEEIEEKLAPDYLARLKFETLKKQTKMEKSTNINNSHRDLIQNALEIYGQVHELYCFAYVTRKDSMCNLLQVQQSHSEIHHYYLFAIMSNQNKPIVELQNCVIQLLPKKIKVTLIVETPEQVEKKLKKGDVFRTNLLQTAECWFRKRELIRAGEQIEILKTENKLNDRMKIWESHLDISMDLNRVKDNGCGFIEDRTTAYLLSLSLEQSCLGLIKEHLQFHPTTTNLFYLMDLCDIICPDVTSIFLRHNNQYKAFFHVLVCAQNKYRHSASFNPSSKDIEILDKKVPLFNKKIKKFMETYFQQQKELQEANKTENIDQCA